MEQASPHRGQRGRGIVIAMLLTFKKVDATAAELGAYKELRFDGDELRSAPQAAPIAKHREHRWHVRGEDFLRLDCDGPLTVTFVDGPTQRSRQYGPYAHFSSVNGIGYRDHEVFCQLDVETNKWFLNADQSEWSTLILEDASP
jgi:hypothetical protein